MDATIVTAIIFLINGICLVVTTFKRMPFSYTWPAYQFMIGLICIVVSVGLIKSRVDGWSAEAQQFFAVALVIGAIVFAKLIVTKFREAVSTEK